MPRKPRRDYDHQTLHEARSYGFFWYDWIWRILRPVLIFFCGLCIVGGILYTGWQWVDKHYVAPVDISDTAPIPFEIKSGSSLTRVASDLESANLVRNRSVFKYYSDFMGLGQKLQPGEYTLTRAMTIQEMIDTLSAGDGKPNTAQITVIPGWTIEDIAERFAADGIIKEKNEFLNLCRTGTNYKDYYYIADVLAAPKANQRKYVLEGYLSPNTYQVFTNATTDEIIKKLLAQTEAAFPSTYFERAEELGMTMDQVLTLASMIEKEGKTAEFAKVSAVFHNRLSRNETLGSDVTIKYALGITKMALNESDHEVNSGYNTYKNRGLPVGPVCNPSGDAILAALYPDEQFIAQKMLYFCSKDPDNGELAFAKTQKEHEANVAKYRPLWIEYDKKRGL